MKGRLFRLGSCTVADGKSGCCPCSSKDPNQSTKPTALHIYITYSFLRKFSGRSSSARFRDWAGWLHQHLIIGACFMTLLRGVVRSGKGYAIERGRLSHPVSLFWLRHACARTRQAKGRLEMSGQREDYYD